MCESHSRHKFMGLQSAEARKDSKSRTVMSGVIIDCKVEMHAKRVYTFRVVSSPGGLFISPYIM